MSGSDLGALLPLLLLVAAFVFLVLRPARNRQRQMAALQNSLDVGSDVMLTSGVFGEVTWIGDETLEVEIAPDTVVRVHRQAIGKVLSDEESARMANEPSDVFDSEESETDDDEFETSDSGTESDLTPDADSSESGSERDIAASDRKQSEKGD
ncbi:MAG TPA: preprotein translocase subunit YajC [Nocardioidaceae bacterium]|nr:preprotein translocase subunit YajC [Nocardioidaceae bacterium]